jgi:hypothetical protein
MLMPVRTGAHGTPRSMLDGYGLSRPSLYGFGGARRKPRGTLKLMAARSGSGHRSFHRFVLTAETLLDISR